MRTLSRMKLLGLVVPALLAVTASFVLADMPPVIEVIATKDSKFEVVGQKEPIITVQAGELIRLKITAQKGTEYQKDGTVHSFTVMEFIGQGWNLPLKEGTQEYTLVVPDRPGEYVIHCTVKCGKEHDNMKAKLIVKP